MNERLAYKNECPEDHMAPDEPSDLEIEQWRIQDEQQNIERWRSMLDETMQDRLERSGNSGGSKGETSDDDVDYYELAGVEAETPSEIEKFCKMDSQAYGLPRKCPIRIPQQLDIDPEVLEGWVHHWDLYYGLEEESQEVYREAFDRWTWDSGSDEDKQIMDDCQTLQRELMGIAARHDDPWGIHQAEPQSVREACDRVWHAIQKRNDPLQDARQRRASSGEWGRPEKLTPWMKLLETVFVRKHFYDPGSHASSYGSLQGEALICRIGVLASLDKHWGACLRIPDAYRIDFNYDLVDQDRVIPEVAFHIALEACGWTDRMYELPYDFLSEGETKRKLYFIFDGLDVTQMPRIDLELVKKVEADIREKLLHELKEHVGYKTFDGGIEFTEKLFQELNRG
jgi:hypothetical protein